MQCEDGQELYAAVYIMNEPYQSQPALPGQIILWKGFWKDAGRMDYRKMRFKKLSMRPEKK